MPTTIEQFVEAIILDLAEMPVGRQVTANLLKITLHIRQMGSRFVDRHAHFRQGFDRFLLLVRQYLGQNIRQEYSTI